MSRSSLVRSAVGAPDAAIQSISTSPCGEARHRVTRSWLGLLAVSKPGSSPLTRRAGEWGVANVNSAGRLDWLSSPSSL